MTPRLYKCMHPYPAIEQQIGEAAHATPRGPNHKQHCAVQMRKGGGHCHTRCFKFATRIERAIAIPDESNSHYGLGGPLPCPMNHNRNTDWGRAIAIPNEANSQHALRAVLPHTSSNSVSSSIRTTTSSSRLHPGMYFSTRILHCCCHNSAIQRKFGAPLGIVIIETSHVP